MERIVGGQLPVIRATMSYDGVVILWLTAFREGGRMGMMNVGEGRRIRNGV